MTIVRLKGGRPDDEAWDLPQIINRAGASEYRHSDADHEVACDI
jgi:hypothetical protein